MPALNTSPVRGRVLGKRAPRIDPRTLQFSKYLLAPEVVAPTPPPEVSWVMKVDDWGVLGNDVLGDCVPAAMLHSVQQWTHYAGTEVVPSDQDALRLYEAIGGYVPGDPSTDQGVDMLSALNYWRKTGITVGKTNHKIAAYVQIDPKNRKQVQTAIMLFGNVFTGLQLPISAQPQTGWTVPDGGPFKDGSPGSWGGHCLEGSTRIPLLSGGDIAIADMIPGKEYWVYGCGNNGGVVPGRATALGRTRELAPLVRVTLDNGEYIRCTPDHPFMMRAGQYLRADQLKAGDSLMPLYRRLSDNVATPGYEECYNPNTNKWRLTHRIVGGELKKLHRGQVVHHRDFDKYNNDPSNLQIMSWDEHTELHAKFPVGDGLLQYSKSKEGRAKSSELMSALWANPEWAAKTRAKLSATASTRIPLEDRRRAAEDRWRNATPEKREQWAAISRANLAVNRLCAAANNHAVVSVELDGIADVYDITVEGCHNFATSAGVFVHNCVPVMAGSPQTLSCITWGERLKMSHNFFDDYVDELYALLTIDWIEKSGMSPGGFNLSQLMADMKIVAA